MRLLDKMRLRLRSLFRRGRVESELDAELRFHLDQLIEEDIASGMTPDEARWAALRTIGGVTRFQEECRDMRRVSLIENLAQDIRYAIRTLGRTPAFTGVVVATLALGIGGITAVFSVVEAVLVAPLPYEESGQLVRFYQEEPDVASSRTGVTGPHFQQIRDHAASFEDVAAFQGKGTQARGQAQGTFREAGLDLATDGQAQRLRVLRVTSGYFRTLRSGPLRGRGFEREDEVGARLLVLSDAVWRNRFRGDLSVIGRTVYLSAEPYVVIGIAPRGFEDPIVGQVDAWLPYDLAGNTNEEDYTLTAIGRLRNGVSFDQARAEIAALTQSLAEQWPGVRANTLVARPLKEDLVAASRDTLRLLLIAVGLTLLAACVNVANLLVVRATGRIREFAIRSALGSGSFRIARQLLVESALLAALGGLLGLALAAFAVRVLRALGRDAIPRLDEVGFDPLVLGFAALATLATGIVFGLLPAFRFGRIQPGRALGAQSRSATGSRGWSRLRSGLAAAQLALALTLLAGAGVLTASFYRLRHVDLGFRVERVLTFDLSLPAVRYDAERRAAFQEELARRMEAIPGVTAAGGTSYLPATGTHHAWPVRVDSGPLAGTVPKILTGGTDRQAEQRMVSGNFFTALQIPVLAGRVFDAQDDRGAPPRAVVSADFARQAFPGMPLEEVVGQQIAIFSQENAIIGVVGDVALDAHGAPGATVYRAHRQNAGFLNWALTLVVATDLAPERILPAVRGEVAAMDPQLVVHRTAPMAEVVGRGVSRERFALVLMGAFTAVALALAAVGLYGLLAYSVRQRTREIGIRMALGATAAQVRNLVLRQAAVVLGIGLLGGIAGALAIGRWLSSLVFETSPTDPRVLLVTALLSTLVGLLSAWLPARRASRVEPRIAIQEE
jgi:predicted permease